nr:hypothetical protein [Tanacetum cinerariifolium]
MSWGLVWKIGVHGCSVVGCAGGCHEFGEDWNGGCFAGYDDSDMEFFEGFDKVVRVDEEVVKRLMVMMRVFMMNHLNATVPYAPGTQAEDSASAATLAEPKPTSSKCPLLPELSLDTKKRKSVENQNAYSCNLSCKTTKLLRCNFETPNYAAIYVCNFCNGLAINLIKYFSGKMLF